MPLPCLHHAHVFMPAPGRARKLIFYLTRPRSADGAQAVLRGDEKEAHPELQTPGELAESIVANVFEGRWGSRGELWVVGQAVIIGSVIAAPDIPAFSVATRLAGVLVMLFGLAIAVVGAAELGPSLSPWPRPIAANELQTDGIYSLCRHPMYAGFLCGAAGLGLLTASAERLLLALVLYAVLSAKAAREEDWMREKHGASYNAWEVSVPRFFPEFEALKSTLASLK